METLCVMFSSNEKVFYGVSIAFSAVLLILSGYYLLARVPRFLRKPITVSRLLPVSGLLMACVFCLRYCVGMYMNWHPEQDYIVLNLVEEIGNALVHSLQTFSMDESYTEYLQQGKQMIRYMQDAESVTTLETIYGMYSSFVSLVAPIIGGALLLDILANLLPGFRLWLANFNVLRPKYYFSEMNPQSVMLAKSLQAISDNKRKPVFVFAKAGKDTAEELLKSAKGLQPICMEYDLEHICKCRIGRRSYFLVSEDENANLRVLAGLSQQSCGGYLACANIYLFTVGDAYIQAESKMYANLARWGMPLRKKPLLYPVHTAHNMISNLLVDVPLYEPLIHKVKAGCKNPRLKLTILGSGINGMEMLLSAYSFGQMLDTTLEITVVSRESEAEFLDKLHVASPELMATTQPGHPILCYNQKGDCNAPYCSVDYISCDVKSKEFMEMLQPECRGKTLRDTDYFLVSLGEDSDNIAASELLIRQVGTWHLHDRDARTVIACVVTDSDLAQLLGEGDRVRESIYFHAIGSLSEVYSARNVLMLSHSRTGAKHHENYEFSRKEAMEKLTSRQKDAYSAYSSMARGMHKTYRVFSASLLCPEPLITESVFTTGGHQSECYLQARNRAEEAYLRLLDNGGKEQLTEEESKFHTMLMHRLAWLEHRRWNAYIRASGFRHTDRYLTYIKQLRTHKNLRLKLHPCLVECNADGILGHVYPNGTVEKKTLRKARENDPQWQADFGHREWDLLDILSFDLYDRGYNDYDFKFYDYPADHEIKDQPEDKKAEKASEDRLLATFAAHGGALVYAPKLRSKFWYRLPPKWDAEQAAKAVHDQWMQARIAEGWTLGAQRDDELRTTPRLVPYEQLPESEKAYDRGTVTQTVTTLLSLDYILLPKGGAGSVSVSKDHMEQLAEAVHDRWAAKRMQEGWTWGEMRDDQRRTTPCLVPYGALPDQEKEYDRKTAKSTLEVLLASYDLGRKCK